MANHKFCKMCMNVTLNQSLFHRIIFGAQGKQLEDHDLTSKTCHWPEILTRPVPKPEYLFEERRVPRPGDAPLRATQ